MCVCVSLRFVSVLSVFALYILLLLLCSFVHLFGKHPFFLGGKNEIKNKYARVWIGSEFLNIKLYIEVQKILTIVLINILILVVSFIISISRSFIPPLLTRFVHLPDSVLLIILNFTYWDVSNSFQCMSLIRRSTTYNFNDQSYKYPCGCPIRIRAHWWTTKCKLIDISSPHSTHARTHARTYT